MYIRRVRTHNKSTGESYATHRLVRSERVGKRVRQLTLLNLGRHFGIARQDWPSLCGRIEDILGGQEALLPADSELELLAQQYAAQLLLRHGHHVSSLRSASSAKAEKVYVEVDPDSLEVLEPRSIGVEHVALSVMREIGFVQELERLGFKRAQSAAAIGNVIARMAQPASELATWGWLRNESALGEMLEFDFETMPLMRLYRASDLLLRHQARIEALLFERVRGLFGLECTVTLYDLTNTYLEGELKGSAKAARGHSKEKRSECLLLTLGLVLDQSGFVRRSQVFAGNAVEARTLQSMLAGLRAPAGALVVMDRGIATEDNLAWLKAQGYRYLVVSRERNRQFDPAQAVQIRAADGGHIRLQKVLIPELQEARLYCHSAQREQKELAIVAGLTQRFEQGLEKLRQGLGRPRTDKRLVSITERIGRLKEKSHGIGQHYHIEYQTEASGAKVVSLNWAKEPRPGSQMTDPGVYCLRSNETSWTPEQMWRTYIMLTELEAVFRSLKSELGLRPIFHHKDSRSEAHLFISVLAYQFVQIIRTRLADRGIHASWTSLRGILRIQRRSTSSFNTRGGRILSVRKASRPEAELARLYDALALDHNPGGIRKTFHSSRNTPL
ncbi:MAG TPA: IS1634 family transposase [Solirubrobacteraceae bacterium]|nr:IS1634 family transposase [Solirubrobacteraceae bacterium]